MSIIKDDAVLNERTMKSCVYRGDVRHRRFKPVKHDINYPLFMMYLDLDELPVLLKRHWFFTAGKFNLSSFNRDDYLNPKITDLKLAVIDKVRTELGTVADDIVAVRMLTNIRYCGHSFNPVTFYYSPPVLTLCKDIILLKTFLSCQKKR